MQHIGIQSDNHSELGNRTATPIIAHSATRWGAPARRPQRVLARLAATAPVLFVEEPEYREVQTSSLSLSSPLQSVTRAVPVLPLSLRGHELASLDTVRLLLGAALADDGPLAAFRGAVQWFDSPLPAPSLAGAFDAAAIVYDCGDELPRLLASSADSEQREAWLLERADIVLADGEKMGNRHRGRHGNVHVLGSAGDVEHFSTARNGATDVPADIASLQRPILGYFGAVDERLDLALLERLARDLPHASIVVIGAVDESRRDSLPVVDNLHWMGWRDYQQLPAYVGAFNVCLLPYVLDECTDYVNPTKVVDYLAAGKPVVASAIPCVVRQFLTVARVARSHDGFVALVREALASKDADRIERGVACAASRSFDALARDVRGRLDNALTVKASVHAAEPFVLASLADRAGRSTPAELLHGIPQRGGSNLSAGLELAG